MAHDDEGLEGRFPDAVSCEDPGDLDLPDEVHIFSQGVITRQAQLTAASDARVGAAYEHATEARVT